ncbi:type II toxin-antitoxin system PemK/MazF family toxin [Brachybacterium sp. YJGR34]|uniref:type II toxin-antitoxin system PemK/MazF family toxin n=1 Tax=Brachybacterium sp. YJGR34 TaxID=2059911 RepID=UPI000E0A2DBB|nr:type II toxin-antitoxin system PemK/MazF family toxin [Brachybacterium sp. YJGR34]
MSLRALLSSTLRSVWRALRRGDRRAGVRPGSDPRAALALTDRRATPPLALAYAPRDDGRPDAGEIVWAWVPYEEDLQQGKDRPVLVLAEEDAAVGGTDGRGRVLVALMLTSRDHAEAGRVAVDTHGATWVDIGAGAWDRRGRSSEVRADRLLRLALPAVRREGARLERPVFDRVATAVRAAHGWNR